MASAVSLNRLGLLGTAPYPALTALSPDRQTVYLETFGAGTADTVWAFNTSTGARLGTVSLDSPIQFMGAGADGESLVVACPVRRVSLRPFLSAAYAAPDAVLGFSPAFIEAQLHRGTQLSGLSQVAIDLNGRSLNTRILTGDVLRADLDTAVTDGAQTVAVTLARPPGRSRLNGISPLTARCPCPAWNSRPFSIRPVSEFLSPRLGKELPTSI